MYDVLENLKEIEYNILNAKAKYRKESDSLRLMAVTKRTAPELVNIATSNGVCLLGENRVQEYLEKREFYENEPEIHFIGKLQTNKVKFIAEKIDMIDSVDSVKLAREIDKYAKIFDRTIDVLVEINIGFEQSKSGISPEISEEFICEIAELQNIKVCGAMTIPPPLNPEKYFFEMQELFTKLQGIKHNNVSMEILSMGMSGDYIDAVKYGSNILRIGSKLFGKRN